MILTEDPELAEIARIRSEYLRREREIPREFYGWSRPVNQFFHQQLVRTCIAALCGEETFPLDGRKAADIGCGAGGWLLQFAQWGAAPADLFGLDLDEGRVERARRGLPEADLHVGDARHLPWPDQSFDLVSQFTLLTSILSPGVRRIIAAEMLRVLKPDGVILWYDFRYNNPRNPNVRGIGAAEIRSLFQGCRVILRSVTLAPPVARLVVPGSWILALLLEKLPLLKTHYLGIIRRHSNERDGPTR